jgi:Asp-tRNA(Asn)/Glu-tRNA(Gln) amidotransferase A subunit family amidase
LRTGAVSVTELAEAHIRQIERLNPMLNAFADFDAERVRERARKHDAWRGTKPSRPLFGLPVTVKSSIATRGFKCEIGSLLHEGRRAARRRGGGGAAARGGRADSGHDQLSGVPDGL